MSSIRLNSWIAFTIIIGLVSYGFYGYYKHETKILEIELTKVHQQMINKKLHQVKHAWKIYIDEFIQLNRHQFQDMKSVFSFLENMENTRHDVIRAIYYDGQTIYFKHWKKVIKRADKPEPFKVGMLDHPKFKLAEIMEYRDNNYRGAVKIYEKLWLENPDDTYTANAMARCLYQLKDYNRALKMYRQIYLQNPKTTMKQEIPLGLTAALQVINIYEKQNQIEEAVTFALNVYIQLLYDHWILTDVKKDYFKQKIKTIVKHSKMSRMNRKRYKNIKVIEKNIAADREYLQLMKERIIPFIDVRSVEDEQLYHINLEELNHHLFMIKNSNGYYIYEMDIPKFIEQALMVPVGNIEQDDIHIGMDYGLHVIKAAETREEAIVLDDRFPQLKLYLAPQMKLQKLLVSKLEQRSGYFLLSYVIVLVVLTLIFLMLYNQIKLSEIKTEFVSQVSHELKTPLTALRAFSEMIKDNPEMARKRVEQYCGFMEDEARRLARLIDHLLDITRIERKKLNYQLYPQPVDDVVGEAISIFKHMNPDMKKRLKKDMKSKAVVSVDKDAFIRVVLNLLDNAKKYSAGKTKIKASTCKQADRVVIIVEDYGVGMSKSEVKNVFKKFYQAKRTYEETFKGVGLGLAIVKNIIRAHFGKIKIESRLNKGTKVIITLPLTVRVKK